jgi:hypothetical protein
MVNILRFTTNPTLCPFTTLISSPWKKSPNVRLRTKNKAWVFVNSFSFNFLEFLAKIYWANFFPWAEKVKKGRYKGNRTGPRNRVGRPAQSDRPRWAPAAFCPCFSPDCSFSTSFFGQKILREVLNKEIVVPRVLLFILFIWPNWELGNPSHQAIFCTHAVAMVSPRSLELKQGAKEPSMEEAK